MNIGSTQPYYAFDYTDTGIQGMNWAIPPETFEYDFKILQTFHSYLKEGAFVIIPICLFNFFAYRCFDIIKQYKILSPTMIHNFSYWRKILYIDYPVLVAKGNLKRLIKDVPIDNWLQVKTNPINKREMENHAKSWIATGVTMFALENLDAVSLSTENKDYIEKNIMTLNTMIDFCLERKYKPILMTLPSSGELRSLVPQSFIDKYIIENIEKANTKKVPVFNYWSDDRFVNKDYFLNSICFNLKGRKKFTRTVINELKKLA